jgi:transcriptional regulator with XRE-family HTH domain
MASEPDVQARVRARLRQLRFERGLTLAQAAAGAGMAPSTLSRLESGARGIGLAHLPRLAAALGVGVDALLATGPAPDPAPARDGKVWWPVHDGGGRRVYRVRLPATLREPALGSHEGHAWFLVLSGRLRLVTQDREAVLRPGEATGLPTWIPHWVGVVDEPVELLAVFDPDGAPVRDREVVG